MASAPEETIKMLCADAALNALLAWETARQRLNMLTAERNSHRCEVACEGDYSTGDMGQGPCWAGGGDVSLMCEPCQKREALTPDIQAAQKEQSRLRQKMQRQAAKLLQPFQIGNGNSPLSEASESVPSEAHEASKGRS